MTPDETIPASYQNSRDRLPPFHSNAVFRLLASGSMLIELAPTMRGERRFALYNLQPFSIIEYTACTSAHAWFNINVSEPAHFKAPLALYETGGMHTNLSEYSLVYIARN